MLPRFYPVLCCVCGNLLYGPVSYCPYCTAVPISPSAPKGKITDLRQAYRILELQENVSLSQIKQAYADLTQKWNRNRHADDENMKQKALVKVRELTEAFECIMLNLDTDNDQRKDNSEIPPESSFVVPKMTCPKCGQGDLIQTAIENWDKCDICGIFVLRDSSGNKNDFQREKQGDQEQGICDKKPGLSDRHKVLKNDAWNVYEKHLKGVEGQSVSAEKTNGWNIAPDEAEENKKKEFFARIATILTFDDKTDHNDRMKDNITGSEMQDRPDIEEFNRKKSKKRRITYSTWDEFEKGQGEDPLKKRFMSLARKVHDLVIEALGEQNLPYEVRYGGGTFSFSVPNDHAKSGKRTCARFGLLDRAKDRTYFDSLYMGEGESLPEKAQFMSDGSSRCSYDLASLEDFEKVKQDIKKGVVKSYRVLAK